MLRCKAPELFRRGVQLNAPKELDAATAKEKDNAANGLCWVPYRILLGKYLDLSLFRTCFSQF